MSTLAKKTDAKTTVHRPKILYTPRVDLIEDENQIRLVADMPGVSADNVDVTLDKNILTINGEMDAPDADGMRLVHREYRSSVYRRTFKLSNAIDRNNITAIVTNGVLHLTLPKAEAVKTRRIPIITD